MDSAKKRRVEKVIADSLATDFEAVRILQLDVRDDVDSDGDDVLRVYVIFEGAPKDLDARKLSSAVRNIRPKLSAIGENAFPLFSFISKNDIGGSQHIGTTGSH